ncbi:MAG: hypothetical protein LYZ69_07115 [Nitrososphaerales archaeon]|nr:hypothetical protein [Nitrososphaerales archaeon]
MTQFRFHVGRDLNLFCHTIALFPESFRSEGSAFNNARYRQIHPHLRTEQLTRLFSDLLKLGWADWDFVGLSLLGGDTGGSFESRIRDGFGRLASIWSAILDESWKGYAEMWPEVQSRLNQHKSRFEEEWKPMGEGVMQGIREISETSWNPDLVDVQLVDSLNGGASFASTILLAPVANLEIEKKLLAHELSESAFSAKGLQAKLESRNANPEFFHAVVDTAAYFALKAWLKPEYVEKLKPNPAYYVGAEPVYSAFEKSSPLSGAYRGLDGLIAAVAEESAGLRS